MSHMRVPSIHTMKLNDRNKVIVYLGKELGTKAHRLYDPQEKEIFVVILYMKNKIVDVECTDR